MRDQIKANCTRALREHWPVFADRPVWTVGGDWQCVNTEDDLDQVVLYAGEVQEGKNRDIKNQPPGSSPVSPNQPPGVSPG